MTAALLSSFTFNLKADPGLIRHDVMEGQKYLVVPCVMITEGVHNGSQGALFYPSEELAKTPQVWNGRPVVVYHPELNGIPISAGDPDVWDRQKVGVLMNARYEDGKLKADCWINEDKLRDVDERVINALEEGTVMEVSTGLFTDNEVISGEWNGVPYDAICRNYRPDHLAILPDKIGACSISDGAGLLRNQALQEEKWIEYKVVGLRAVYNTVSHNEVFQKLSDKLRGPEDAPMVWVVDVYDDFVIFEKGETLYHQEYLVGDDDEITLQGIAQPVERDVQYKFVDGTIVGNSLADNPKEDTVDKEKIVKALIDNETSPFTEEDKERLMGFSESVLEHLTANEEKPDDEEGDSTPNDADATTASASDGNAETESAPETNQRPLTLDEYIANAPEGARDMLREGVRTNQAQRHQLIEAITANERNSFSKETLQAMTMDDLRAIGRLADVDKPTTAPQPHFGGLAPVMPAVNAQVTEEPLIAPELDFANKE